MRELIEQLEKWLQNELHENAENELSAIYSRYEAETTAHQSTNENISESPSTNDAEHIESQLELDQFTTLYNEAKKRLEKKQIEKATIENTNLIQKREIIQKLKELSDSNIDSLGDAFKTFNELKDIWKNTGNVPEKHYLSLQRDYRFYNEQFFYVIKIYKDLKEHDTKKNTQLKQQIIQRLKSLAENTQIKELESGVKQLQNEWDEIGPVVDSEWEKLRDEFKELLNSVYQKIQEHHHQLYEAMQSNLQQKEALVQQLKDIVSKELNTSKKYEDATQEVLKIQEAYKKIGFAKKKENERIWSEFRNLCNQFFEAKKVFFDEIHSQFSIGKEKKEKLIREVEAIKSNTDWNTSTKKILALQKEWKESPTAGYKTDTSLWNLFRSHCDYFFNAKKEYFESLKNAEQENLSKKYQLIKRMQEYTPSNDALSNITSLNKFKEEWDSIGYVPKSEIDKVYHLYQDALNKIKNDTKISAEVLDDATITALVNNTKNNPEAQQQLKAERQKIKDELQKLDNSIQQKENNLLFFAKSKNADALLEDVNKQLQADKEKANQLRTRLKKLSI